MFRIIQGDQLHMGVVCFLYLVKRGFFSLHYFTVAYTIRHFLQGTRTTRPCISGLVVGAEAGSCSRCSVSAPLLWILRVLRGLCFQGTALRTHMRIVFDKIIMYPRMKKHFRPNMCSDFYYED